MFDGNSETNGSSVRSLWGRTAITIAIGACISLLIALSALYMSTSAGRSALPSPLSVQTPLVPQVASIAPAPGLFVPPVATGSSAPAVEGGGAPASPAGAPAGSNLASPQTSFAAAPAASTAPAARVPSNQPASGARAASVPSNDSSSDDRSDDHRSDDHDDGHKRSHD